MKRVRIVEAETGRELLRDVGVAERALDRFLGLMGREGLRPGEGLFFPRCSSIHMCFMKFAIDAVYLDSESTVKRIKEGLKPWRFSWCPWAWGVLEAPAGWARSIGLEPGRKLLFEDIGPGRE